MTFHCHLDIELPRVLVHLPSGLCPGALLSLQSPPVLGSALFQVACPTELASSGGTLALPLALIPKPPSCPARLALGTPAIVSCQRLTKEAIGGKLVRKVSVVPVRPEMLAGVPSAEMPAHLLRFFPMPRCSLNRILAHQKRGEQIARELIVQPEPRCCSRAVPMTPGAPAKLACAADKQGARSLSVSPFSAYLQRQREYLNYVMRLLYQRQAPQALTSIQEEDDGRESASHCLKDNLALHKAWDYPLSKRELQERSEILLTKDLQAEAEVKPRLAKSDVSATFVSQVWQVNVNQQSQNCQRLPTTSASAGRVCTADSF